MADIKLEDLDDGEQSLNPETMKGIYGGAGSSDAAATTLGQPADPNQLPVVVVGSDGSLPGQGDAGAAGGGGGGSCQL